MEKVANNRKKAEVRDLYFAKADATLQKRGLQNLTEDELMEFLQISSKQEKNKDLNHPG